MTVILSERVEMVHQLYRIDPLPEKVEILTGKDKGKQGIVNCIIKERNWCFVEGMNCKYDLQQKSRTFPGVLHKEEKPLLVTTEVALVDPSDNKGTAVDWRFTDDGKQVRVSRRTGRILPLSALVEDETEDFVKKSSYKERDKDTSGKLIEKVTFVPKLCTFEEDIMNEMGIEDDRERAPTLWY